MLKRLKKGHAGLGGTSSGNKKYKITDFLRGDVFARVRAHGEGEYRDWDLIGIIVVYN
jgi:hypothetical protein